MIAMDVLEPTLSIRLAFNSPKTAACLCLLSARTIGMLHHCPAKRCSYQGVRHTGATFRLAEPDENLTVRFYDQDRKLESGVGVVGKPG